MGSSHDDSDIAYVFPGDPGYDGNEENIELQVLRRHSMNSDGLSPYIRFRHSDEINSLSLTASLDFNTKGDNVNFTEIQGTYERAENAVSSSDIIDTWFEESKGKAKGKEKASDVGVIDRDWEICRRNIRRRSSVSLSHSILKEALETNTCDTSSISSLNIDNNDNRLSLDSNSSLFYQDSGRNTPFRFSAFPQPPIIEGEPIIKFVQTSDCGVQTECDSVDQSLVSQTKVRNRKTKVVAEASIQTE